MAAESNGDASIGDLVLDDGSGWRQEYHYSTLDSSRLVLTHSNDEFTQWASGSGGTLDDDEAFEHAASDGSCAQQN
jgi:hypothetical protein